MMVLLLLIIMIIFPVVPSHSGQEIQNGPESCHDGILDECWLHDKTRLTYSEQR